MGVGLGVFRNELAIKIERRTLLSAVWLVGGMTLVGIVVALVTSRYRRDRAADLGTVSHQWMAEQRFGGPRNRHSG